MRIDSLSNFELEVFEHLPVEPNGLSVDELADGLLDNRGPQARSQVRRAVLAVAEALDGIFIRRGDDDFGHADIPLFGIRAADAGRVREFFAAEAQRTQRK